MSRSPRTCAGCFRILSEAAEHAASEATATFIVGEELALFDTHASPPQIGDGIPFAEWYPDPAPDQNSAER